MIPVVLFTLAATNGTLDRLTQEVAASGQVVELAVKPADRVSPPVEIAPGQPPLLSFRYYEGQERHRFSNTELMLDDAGH
jgi:hypothetical protein